MLLNKLFLILDLFPYFIFTNFCFIIFVLITIIKELHELKIKLLKLYFSNGKLIIRDLLIVELLVVNI